MTHQGDGLNYRGKVTSHWRPGEKIGKSFYDVHLPVPEAEKLMKASFQYAEIMCTKGPFVRFVWSFVTDTEFNHHAEIAAKRIWQTSGEPFYLRVERQITIPLIEEMSSLFLIKLSFLPASLIAQNKEYAIEL